MAGLPDAPRVTSDPRKNLHRVGGIHVSRPLACLEGSDKKIQAVLNADQKKKYEQMKLEMRDEMHERMQERKNGSTAP